MPKVRPGGEAAIALRAGKGPFLCVDAAVANQLRGHPEGLAAVRTLVALWLSVDAPVVLERHEVGELFAAGTAEVGACLVAVAVVKERAGVAVRPPTLVAHMGSEGLAAPTGAAGSGYTAAPWVESLLLHQGEVQS